MRKHEKYCFYLQLLQLMDPLRIWKKNKQFFRFALTWVLSNPEFWRNKKVWEKIKNACWNLDFGFFSANKRNSILWFLWMVRNGWKFVLAGLRKYILFNETDPWLKILRKWELEIGKSCSLNQLQSESVLNTCLFIYKHCKIHRKQSPCLC